MSPSTPLRRDLLFSFGALFAGAVLLAGVGLAILLPVLESPAQGMAFVVVLVAADLLVLFVFGGALIRKSVVAPVERLEADTRQIAQGDYHHRVGPLGSLELDQLAGSVNAMADRLTADQKLLADNVASLERTNLELVQARDQVVNAERLASVGTLAAGIAHEVGNPLGAIMAFVDVARSRAVREGADPELLDSIREEAQRIHRIVRGLLDYARPRDAESGRSRVAAVLERVRGLLQNQGRLDRVENEWLLETEVPDVVMEPHRLEQVMVNLLLNSIDALEGSPSPRIVVRLWSEEGAVARLPLRRADDPPGINYMHRRRLAQDEGAKGIDPLFNAPAVTVIQVEDNGTGIPEDQLERVFDPFFTTKEPGKGTGLGLSICARLVEGMGGRISADNVPGGGACFTIRLPGTAISDREPEPQSPEQQEVV